MTKKEKQFNKLRPHPLFVTDALPVTQRAGDYDFLFVVDFHTPEENQISDPSLPKGAAEAGPHFAA